MPAHLKNMVAGLDRSQIREGLTQSLGVAAFLARLTPTPKDDAAVLFLSLLITDDSMFNAAMDALGVP